MEVQYAYTRDDWVHINVQTYKDWLHALRPLSDVEYWTCWFLLVFSLLAALGCLVFLGYAIWFNQAWYLVVGSVVVFVLLCGMVLEVLHPRREAVRGLFQELIFRLHWEPQLIAKATSQKEQYFRRLEDQGQLNLGHRYHVRIDPEGYTLTVDFPAASGPAARQETQRAWSEVRSIHLDERMLFLKIGDAGYEAIPRSAFGTDEACQLFAKTAEQYRLEHASGGSDRKDSALTG